METQAVPLKAFDEWLAGASAYKLERPSNLGRHSRFLMTEITVETPLPNFMPLLHFSKLLAIRSLKMLQEGRAAQAERDLRTIFALGSFLQQTPVLLSQMSGLAVHRRGLGIIARYVNPGAQREEFEAMLPDLRRDIEMLRWAFLVDGLALQDALENEKFEHVRWWDKLIGTYSKARTRQLYLRGQRELLNYLDKGRLGSSFAVPIHADCESEPKGLIHWIKWLPNAIGRRIVCELSLIEYGARFGQTMDQVEATRVVVAARRFRQKHSRWPTQETELVPTYLKEWPKSALDGEPLRWLEDKSGVRVLGRDGKGPCVEKFVLCEFRFEPLQTVGNREQLHKRR